MTIQPRRPLLAVIVALAGSAPLCRAAAPPPSFTRLDEAGRLERLAVGQGWGRASTELRLIGKGWGRTATLPAAQNLKMVETDGTRAWTGTLALSPGPALDVQQAARLDGGKLTLDFKATAHSDGDIEGLVLWLNLPADEFAGGSFAAGEQTVALPAKLPDPIHLWSGKTAALRFRDGKGRVEIAVEMVPALRVTVQDGRKWGNEFNVMIFVQDKNLPRGQSASAQVRLAATGEVDQTPVQATIDPAKVRYRLTGIGGNYCFNIDSPVARFTLDNLKVAAARTEISLRPWEPKNIGGPPGGDADRGYQPFAAADQPGSRLRQEFELMRELTRKRIPFTASIWRMPAWMTDPASPNAPPNQQEKRRITAGQWPEVLQSLGTYLLYAKDKHQAEPDYFSFNEPNIGVDILLNAEEHRDMIKRVGAHLAKLGLTTKLLLGDATGPRGTHTYCLPAANDPEAMRYVGAVAFHSWGGGRPEHYNAWADLAERLNKPLIVAEAGVDASAWRSRAYRGYAYAVREMVHYQELLLHARPQSILYWEFTGDYSLLASERVPRGNAPMTERFCLQKHWCDLTPAGAEALTATAEPGDVLVTAFRLPGAGAGAAAGPDWTIHLANPKWQRTVNLRGLPAEIRSLQMVRTAQDEMFQPIGELKVSNGAAAITLPGESLTTLTTLPVPRVKPMAGAP